MTNIYPTYQITEGKVFCPLCKTTFQESDYLKTVIPDPKVLWIANMITHYRHNYIKSWNKCWGYGGGRYRSGWFGDYDAEKTKVNNRAKRQIIRQAAIFLKHHGIDATHFEQLQQNDYETLALAKAKLGGNIQLPEKPKPIKKEVFTDESIMPFGIHKDKKKLKDVPDQYLLWLYNNDRMGKLKPYITENIQAIRKNVLEQKFKKR